MASGRRIVPLTLEPLLELGLTPWGRPWPAPGPVVVAVHPADAPGPATELAPWAARTLHEWGHCGMVAEGLDDPLGLLLIAPAALAPRVGALAPASSGPDTAVLLSVVVDVDQRRQGIGRHLVQSAAADLVGRGVVALEAVGHRVGAVDQGGLPEEWLTAVGFRLVRDHPLAPRYRMDLTSTVRWRPDLGAAWQRIRSLVAQPTPPEPARFEAGRFEAGRFEAGRLEPSRFEVETPTAPGRDYVVPRTAEGTLPAPSR